ncbi:MAG: 30S ribosomal protein S1 [Candidatus Comchoanobacterales bacterium]
MTELKDEFISLLDNQSNQESFEEGAIIKARVLAVKGNEVCVDVGKKSETIISLSEFIDETGKANVAAGDTVSVMLESLDDGSGNTTLSREKAVKQEAWHALENAMNNDLTVLGVITERVKGGFTVVVHGIRAFLPGSQIDVRPTKDETVTSEESALDFKVIKMDAKRSNIVVSRRAVLDTSKEDKQALLDKLAEGQVVKGIVKNLTDYGAFVDLGGIDGLLHITDLAWKRVKHPSEVLKVGEEIDVKILSFDPEKQRVSLGVKQLSGDPWSEITEKHPINSKLFGKVTNITEYGCFVEIENGIEGLVHMSEMDWTNKNIHPSKVVQIGQEVEVMVLEIDESRRRISLGLKQCKPNPWAEFSERYAEQQVITGTIKSITDFGVFIGLDGGIDGLIHSNDLSWIVPGDKAVQEFKKGQEVSAVITSIDAERERISLSIKHCTEDPYEDFFMSHNRGSEVSGKVVEIIANSKRVVVELNHESKIRGVLKLDEFENQPEVDDELPEIFVLGSDRKNFYVPLSLSQPFDAAYKKEQHIVAPDTLGDLFNKDSKK